MSLDPTPPVDWIAAMYILTIKTYNIRRDVQDKGDLIATFEDDQESTTILNQWFSDALDEMLSLDSGHVRFRVESVHTLQVGDTPKPLGDDLVLTQLGEEALQEWLDRHPGQTPRGGRF
jgi:hypothetical protein